MTRRKQTGQAIAELAILLPVLMLIVLGCLDLGRAYSVWVALCNATREGARYASIYPYTAEDGSPSLPRIIARTQADAQAEGITLRTEDIEVVNSVAVDQPVTVSASYDLQLMTLYLFGGGPVRIKARTEMMIITGVRS